MSKSVFIINLSKNYSLLDVKFFHDFEHHFSELLLGLFLLIEFHLLTIGTGLLSIVEFLKDLLSFDDIAVPSVDVGLDIGQGLVQSFEHIPLRVLVLVVECSHDVVQLLRVADCNVLQVPVVDHECQVVPDFDLLRHLVPVSESVAHDGDQHVQ